jgi:hypothetical protein
MQKKAVSRGGLRSGLHLSVIFFNPQQSDPACD